MQIIINNNYINQLQIVMVMLDMIYLYVNIQL